MYKLGIFVIIFFAACSGLEKKTSDSFFAMTKESVPSHAVFPDVPCWTKFARTFIYAPAFKFPSLEGAIKYKFTITSTKSNQEFIFEDERPNQSLSPVWESIPIGGFKLKIEGIDSDGKIIGTVMEKQLYRSAPFRGISNTPKAPYRDVAIRTLEGIYKLPYIQKWLVNDEPDLTYSLFGYPSKIISSLMDGMLHYSALPSTTKEDSVKAMKIVLKMADHLSKISKSRYPVLSAFPPTYDLDFVKKRKQVPGIADPNGVNSIATLNANKLMMLYGYEYADVILNLYDRTKDEKWMRKVIDIADAYKKLQLPNGTWHLKLDYHTGQPVDTHMMMPTQLMSFLKRLEGYDRSGYKEVIAKAQQWMNENPMRTFFWEGQFEDVPSYPEMYHNMSKYPPTHYAMYLLEHDSLTEQNVNIARELVRFSEDQFVMWEPPQNDPIFYNQWVSKDTVAWMAPCALEQYHFYVPVDASACQMIKSYMALFRVTKDTMYMQKATALANSITHAQLENGEIATVWTHQGFRMENWLNCMIMSAKTLLEFDSEQ